MFFLSLLLLFLFLLVVATASVFEQDLHTSLKTSDKMLQFYVQ